MGEIVTNPKTGEIVQGHEICILEFFVSNQRSIYKHLEGLSKEQPIVVPTPPTPGPVTGPTLPGTTNFSGNFFNLNSLFKKPVANIHDHDVIEKFEEFKKCDHHSHSHDDIAKAKINDIDYTPYISNFRNITHGISAEDLIEKLNGNNFLQKRDELYAKNNAFHKSFLNYGSLGKVITKEIRQMTDIIDANGHLVTWEKLKHNSKRKSYQSNTKASVYNNSCSRARS